MSNPNKLRGFGNAEGNKIDSGLASPDALVTSKGDSTYHRESKAREERRAKLEAQKAERTAKLEAREKKLKRVGKVLGGVAIAATAAGAILLAEKEPNKPLEKEAWEATMEHDTAGYNANLAYGEDGSTISIKDSHNGVQTNYTFFDEDNDAYIERAHSSNSNGGADVAFGEATTFKGALSQINAKMDANN